MSIRPGRTAALSALLLFVLAGCTTQQRVRTETALAKALISDEQSEQLGKQVHEELEKQDVEFLDDPVVEEYVDSIAARILPLAEQDREIDYHVHVIDDPKTVNAFAAPGGHLYLYTGLLLAAENEAEVAGVMAHEAGHIAGRHIERQLVNAYGLQAVTMLALGQDASMLKQLAAALAGTGILRAHSRSEEIEADEYGARYTAEAGYDPRALITFFEKLAEQAGDTPRALTWLSTHPTSQNRIENLEEYIEEEDLDGDRVGRSRHEEITRRLDGGRRDRT
ncbi:MAG TPA: M48 family metallopeptidase [Candidatus Polarisedimenticolia bacterium]|nr:M48 family metallopeptidase [Candidatus Polarisedimenticolia bacterium]